MGETTATENNKDEEKLVTECLESTKTYLQQVAALGDASGSLSLHWAALLAQTPCGPAAKQFKNACDHLQGALSRSSGQMLTELTKVQEKLTKNGKPVKENGPSDNDKPSSQTSQNDMTDSSEELKVITNCFASLVSFHCHVFLQASESLAQFSQADPSDNSDRLVSSEQDSLKGVGENVVPPEGSTESKVNGQPMPTPLEGAVDKTPDGTADKMVVGSPSGLRKLSSFLSKLGRSSTSPNATDSSQSFFYVDMPEQGKAEQAPSAADKSGVKQKVLDHAAGGLHANQHVIGASNGKDSISQEELDSVIDFLSGFKVPMQTIHEHIPSHQVHSLHSNSRAVGSHLNSMNSGQKDTDYTQQLVNAATLAAANASAGANAAAGATMADRHGGKTHKTNTWPYRLSTKGATAEMASPYSAFGLGEAAMADPEYWRYLNSVGNLKQADVLGSRSAWQGPIGSHDNPGLNRSWPHQQAMGQEIYEGSGRGWSCATGDSSSCSDESSNGEAPWMMGFDLMNSVNSKRRHSSGEDGLMPTNQVAMTGPRQNPTDGRPRSVEDLLEPKSNKTWPPKQPWARGQPQEGSTEEQPMEGATSQPVVHPQPYHPPLTMQWSDPLTNRPLSTWGTGLNPPLSNQGVANYGSGLL